MSESCSKCRFFKTRQGVGKMGNCRYNPPVEIVFDGMLESRWPKIKPTLWCGKFERDPRLIRTHQPMAAPSVPPGPTYFRCYCGNPDCWGCT